MSATFTADGQHYFNPAYANAFATAVTKIAIGSTLTTNVEFFMNGTSALSNQVWGGIKRADIIDLGRVTTGDTLELLKNLLDSGNGSDPDSGPRAVLLVTELYSLWVANGIGYYGDTAGSPLFLESEFGLEIYNSNGTLVLGSEDIAALYKASYTGSISTTTSQKTLTTDITATGVLTSDIAFIEDLYLDEVQKVSIPSNGIVRYTSTIITDPTPTSWTTIYKITVVSKGDV